MGPFQLQKTNKKPNPKTKQRNLQQGTTSCVSQSTDTSAVPKLWTNYLITMKQALGSWDVELDSAKYKHEFRCSSKWFSAYTRVVNQTIKSCSTHLPEWKTSWGKGLTPAMLLSADLDWCDSPSTGCAAVLDKWAQSWDPSRHQEHASAPQRKEGKKEVW